MTVMKDIKLGKEAFIWKSFLIPEMSGIFNSNPTKTNKLIYIIGIYIFF